MSHDLIEKREGKGSFIHWGERREEWHLRLEITDDLEEWLELKVIIDINYNQILFINNLFIHSINQSSTSSLAWPYTHHLQPLAYVQSQSLKTSVFIFSSIADWLVWLFLALLEWHWLYWDVLYQDSSMIVTSNADPI